jgi:glycosyltransferase involved in cell wall biosynthesis
MRILVLSNLYPPYFIGGYELGCRDIVEGLAERGHELVVLTSTYGIASPAVEGNIHRKLVFLAYRKGGYLGLFTYLPWKEMRNNHVFMETYHSFRPDILYVWGTLGISRSILFLAQSEDLPICYYVFDHWVTQWCTSDPWIDFWSGNPSNFIETLARLFLKKFSKWAGYQTEFGTLNLQYAQFASHALKREALSAGYAVESARVIPWGIRLNEFPFRETPTGRPYRLLYVGQIVRHKGLHTAIEALGELVHRNHIKDVHLTVVGSGNDRDYLVHIKNLVTRLDLEDKVSFKGKLPHEALPAIYREHDILIFPSVWEEPFGITPLEAMASGLVVVGTATGGSGEIFEDEENALIFPKGDAKACAAKIERLIREPATYERIRHNARHTVESRFSIKRAIDHVEAHLQEIVAGHD